MQSYYQPEKGFRGEDRWLHHVPNGEQQILLWREYNKPACVGGRLATTDKEGPVARSCDRGGCGYPCVDLWLVIKCVARYYQWKLAGRLHPDSQ